MIALVNNVVRELAAIRQESVALDLLCLSLPS